MQERLPGEVGYEECARLALPAECARAEPPLIVAVEYDAHMLHRDDFVARLAAHHLNGVLVAEIVAAFDGVIGVFAPVVAPVGQRRVDAALSRV